MGHPRLSRLRAPLAARAPLARQAPCAMQACRVTGRREQLGRQCRTLERPMTIPHYINEDRSYMRGIKPGWYAADDDGNLFSGPFATHEECVRRIIQPTDGSSLRV